MADATEFVGHLQLRLQAADEAEQVLPFFEKEHPEDLRPREAKASRP